MMKNPDTTNYAEMTKDELRNQASELASRFKGDSTGTASYALYQLERIHHEIDKRAANETHLAVMKHANRALFIAAVSLALAFLSNIFNIGFTLMKSSTASPHRNCNTICVSTNDPCLHKEQIEAIETKLETNKSPEHIPVRPRTASPKILRSDVRKERMIYV